MLTEHDRELLSAYVDGELSNRQRRAALRLLRRSAEARKLLQRLQDDTQLLKKMPRQRLGDDFPGRILRAVAVRQVRPAPRRAPAAPGVPAWAGAAVAAAVLFLVGASFYLYAVGTTGTNEPRPPVVRNERVAPGPSHTNAPGPQERPEKLRPERQDVAPERVAGGPAEPHGPPTPSDEPRDGPVITDRAMELFRPAVADVQVPEILKVRDLDTARLLAALKTDGAFRMELPCRDGTQAFKRLQSVCKAQGVGLVIEPVALGRLGKPPLKTHYVLYTEDLTPQELGRLLRRLGDEDAKAESKKKGDGLFDALVLTRMSDADRKELSGLMGVDPKQIQRAGQGGAPRPGGPDRQALVMAYNPVRPAANAAEVRRFLEGLKSPRDGAVQLLLVLRGTYE